MSRNKPDLQEQQFDVFLSYSRKDTAAAMLLKSAIQALGYSVFYDQEVLEGDNNWRKTIAKNIDCCTGVVFFRTKNSVISKWCQKEVCIAEENGKTILPVAYLHNQNSLPNSQELMLALQLLQTSFISDSPTVAGIKNELQSALEKSMGRPKARPNSLMLTEFLNSAAENMSLRYSDFLSMIGLSRITVDVTSHKITLKMRLSLGDSAADLCIALNKFAKRSECFANCQKHDLCKFYNCKDKSEYFIEAYLDHFNNRSRKSGIYDWLEDILGNINNDTWCGNIRIKYFFREQIMPEAAVDEKNDFQAALILLEKAIGFFDKCVNVLTEPYRFALSILDLLSSEEIVLDMLNKAFKDSAWLSTQNRSREKLHFYRQQSAFQPSEDDLGKLSSVAIRYPEAMRIIVDKIAKDFIKLKLFRFELDKQITGDLIFKFAERHRLTADEIKNELQAAIGSLLKKECKYCFSTLPEYIHEQAADFIRQNPLLAWQVSQPEPGKLVMSGYFYHSESENFPQVKFEITLEYHQKMQTVDWQLGITTELSVSDNSCDDEARLSEITGFPIVPHETAADEEQCRQYFGVITESLKQVHENIYNIYRKLHEIDQLLGQWKSKKAAALLTLGQRSSYIDAYKDNEDCWEYYLSPGMRLVRRLRVADFPVMFSIRFGAAGAQDATIGWCANLSFNTLSVREKEVFWRYVLARFPEELKNHFTYRNNAIFLSRSEDSSKDLRERKGKVFKDVEAIKKVLQEWLAKRPEGRWIDLMFEEIENAVKVFGIWQMP